MTITAKTPDVKAPPQQPVLYELFDDENPLDAIDIGGNPVKIKRSLGLFNKEQLTQQLTFTQAKIDAIDLIVNAPVQP